MSQESIKKRIDRAKAKAINLLQSAGYRVVRADNETFCVIATRRREARFIRVVVDQITDRDRKLVSSVDLPLASCSREIYCLTGTGFRIEEYGSPSVSRENPPTI